MDRLNVPRHNSEETLGNIPNEQNKQQVKHNAAKYSTLANKQNVHVNAFRRIQAMATTKMTEL